MTQQDWETALTSASNEYQGILAAERFLAVAQVGDLASGITISKVRVCPLRAEKWLTKSRAVGAFRALFAEIARDAQGRERIISATPPEMGFAEKTMTLRDEQTGVAFRVDQSVGGLFHISSAWGVA